MATEQGGGGVPGACPEPVFSVAAVARRLGVAPSTLRTWDRRYGLGPSAHVAGAHRRYAIADLDRLIVMRRLTLDGVPPAEAARLALSGTAVREVSGRADFPPDGQTSSGAGVDPGWTEPEGLSSGTAMDPVPPVGAAMDPVPPVGTAMDPVPPVTPRIEVVLRRQPPEASVPGPRPAVSPRGGSSRTGSAPAGPPRASAGPTGPGTAGVRPVPISPGVVRLPVSPGRAPTSGPGDGSSSPTGVSVPPDAAPARSPGTAGPSGMSRYGGRRPLGRAGAVGAAGAPWGARPVPPVPGIPAARGLARAAMCLDCEAVTRLVQESVRHHGVVRSWESLVVPVLQTLGDRQTPSGEGVAVEHAFSEALLSLFSALALQRRPRTGRPVLLACPEGDQHSLPLYALAAALAEEEVPTRMLGAGLPWDALRAAARRCGPAVVFLYARMPVGTCAGIEELPRQRPSPRVIVGGRGWDLDVLPDSVSWVLTLSEAVTEVISAVEP